MTEIVTPVVSIFLERSVKPQEIPALVSTENGFQYLARLC